MHPLLDIAELHSNLNKKIFQYKLDVIKIFKKTSHLHRIRINRNNGYLKIETHQPLNKNDIQQLESDLNLKLDYNTQIKDGEYEIEVYIFKPIKEIEL